MKNSVKPITSVSLFRDDFNSLMSVLDFFVKTEKNYGETYYSAFSKKLFSKIITHGRVIKSKSEEKALIHFFDNEPALIIKLMAHYTNMCEKPSDDFYKTFTKKL